MEHETTDIIADTMVNYGGSIKALGEASDGSMTFGAWLVLFGSPEQTDASHLRDYFTKSTDFDIEDGDKTTVYYNHGLDPELKRRKLGTATLHIKDAGVWMEGQLKARDEYEAKIQELIRRGKLGASSGVPAHLVERKAIGDANEILLWPLGKDASLTATPAEPRTAAMSLKSLIELEEGDETKAQSTGGHWVTHNGRHLFVRDGKEAPAGSEKTEESKKKPSELSTEDYHARLEHLAKQHAGGDAEVVAKVMAHVKHTDHREKNWEDADAHIAHFVDFVKAHEKNRKSINDTDEPETDYQSPDDVISAMKGITSRRMPLEWHSAAVRELNADLLERIHDLVELRGSTKSGRVLSVANHNRLKGHCEALRAIHSDLSELLAAYAPDSGDSDTKSFEQELNELEAAWVRQGFAIQAALHPIPV